MSHQVSDLDLPASPSAEQLLVIQQYLDQQNKIQSSSGYGTQNYYQDRLEIIGKKLIMFQHKQKKKDTWYMRFYAGDKKYKVLSLATLVLVTGAFGFLFFEVTSTLCLPLFLAMVSAL